MATVAWPKPIGHHLGMNTGRQSQGGMGVAQVMQMYLRESGLLHRHPKGFAHPLGMEELPVGAGEHKPGVGPGRTPLQTLLFLATAPGPKHRDRERVKRYETPTPAGLGLVHFDRAVDRYQGATYREPGSFQIEVASSARARASPLRRPVMASVSHRG